VFGAITAIDAVVIDVATFIDAVVQHLGAPVAVISFLII
jgi:hypothetical protein